MTSEGDLKQPHRPQAAVQTHQPELHTQGTPFSLFLILLHFHVYPSPSTMVTNVQEKRAATLRQFLTAGDTRSHRLLNVDKQNDHGDPEVHKRPWEVQRVWWSFKLSLLEGQGRATPVAMERS